MSFPEFLVPQYGPLAPAITVSPFWRAAARREDVWREDVWREDVWREYVWREDVWRAATSGARMIWAGGDLIAGAIRHSRELALMVAEAEGSLRLRISGRPRRQEGVKLRILAYSSSYLPDHRGGSEVTLHRLLQALRSRGHEMMVMTDIASGSTVIDGIEVHGAPDRSEVRELFEWSDVVLAQLKSRQRVAYLAARYSRPYAYYVQIGNSSTATLAGEPDLTLFSSQFVRGQYPQAAPALVVHPIVPEPEYVTTPGECATLINLAEIKGGALFFELARQLPDRQFLGVRGWGPQVTAPPLPNTTLIGTQPDVRDVYSRTRVLLMPSGYESYGRVALEAATSGIPTIAHPVGGIVEAMGDAGLWADRDDPAAWVRHLHALDDPAAYAEQSRRVRRRFDELAPRVASEVDALELALRKLSAGVFVS